jgi:uncharacterized protein YlxW (UPF0749 family)
MNELLLQLWYSRALKEAEAAQKSARRARRRMRTRHATAIRELENKVTALEACVRALAATLVDKGLCTDDEIGERIAVLQQEEGQADRDGKST